MNGHILVVDDEAPTRELLSIYFKNRGCTVTTAENPQEALALFAEVPVQIVILDINLGESNGLDLLEPMKKAKPSVPIIIFSGVMLDDDAVREAKEKGASGILHKTQPLHQMWAEVQRVLVTP
jgi:two-component system torCAD operon response regulator TorR